MISVDTNQQNALAGAYLPLAYLIEFQFSGGTLRFTTWNGNLTWNGYIWAGTGTMGSMSEVKESEKLEALSVDFSLTIADPALVALALEVPETYRGLPAIQYIVPMQDGVMVGTPIVALSGLMDQLTISLGQKDGSITMRVRPLADKMSRGTGLRLNDATQQSLYPNSLGLMYMADLIANPVLWYSVQFQTARLINAT